jgi:hypothetical protein
MQQHDGTRFDGLRNLLSGFPKVDRQPVLEMSSPVNSQYATVSLEVLGNVRLQSMRRAKDACVNAAGSFNSQLRDFKIRIGVLKMQLTVIAYRMARCQNAPQNRGSLDMIQRFAGHKEGCGTPKFAQYVEQPWGDGRIWTIVVGQEKPWMINSSDPALSRYFHFVPTPSQHRSTRSRHQSVGTLYANGPKHLRHDAKPNSMRVDALDMDPSN